MTLLQKILAPTWMLLLAGLISSCALPSGNNPPPRPENGISITVSPDDPKSLIVHGIPPDLLTPIGKGGGALRVTVADAPPGAPALSGSLRREGNDLVFTPRYPFEPGLNYRADLALPPTQPSFASSFSTYIKIPAPPATPIIKIEAIYPTADELPENLLKFYIQFSGPMSRGEAYRHIHLLDDSGHAVAAPFLELGQELWNPEMTRFTLFFDPGRIKQGLVPRLEMGLALERGRFYTLVVDADWQDADHHPLVTAARKKFCIIAADSQQPDPARWQFTAPHSASLEPLTIRFEKPLDHALLERVLSIQDAAGQMISGKIMISNHEQQWSFIPDSPWRPGKFALVVQTILEDTAGNSIGRPFEVDLNKPPAATVPATIELPFEVR
jgi:hypothetical protein